VKPPHALDAAAAWSAAYTEQTVKPDLTANKCADISMLRTALLCMRDK
jgi:hypothetical protein